MEPTQEQVNKLINVFNEIVNIIKNMWIKIKEAFINFINSIDFKKIKQIIKYNNIYLRTKSRRIKKKQIKLIQRILYERN